MTDTNNEEYPTIERMNIIRSYVEDRDEPSEAEYYSALVPSFEVDPSGKEFEDYFRMVETMYSIGNWVVDGYDAELKERVKAAAETAERNKVSVNKLKYYLD